MESISHPKRLAFELHSQEMISTQVRDETVKITGPSTYDRASKLVAAVKDQIVMNRSVLQKFLSVVRGDPSLVYIADAMSDHYRKCNGELLHNYVATPSVHYHVVKYNVKYMHDVFCVCNLIPG